MEYIDGKIIDNDVKFKDFSQNADKIVSIKGYIHRIILGIIEVLPNTVNLFLL